MDQLNLDKNRPFGRRSFLAGMLLVSAAGCKNFIQRGQSPDRYTLQLPDPKPKPKNEGRLIGETCGVYGINFAKVEGIGLAFGLQNTGSNPKPGGQRDYLIRELQSMKLDAKVETILEGKDTELVFLKGLIPPGARKGDRFDIEIGTMRATEATSLEFGTVSKTALKPMEQLGRTIQKGSVVAFGSGRILIDSLVESRKDRSNDLHGFILGGGILIEDREFGLQIEESQASMRNSVGIVKAINARFTYTDRTGRHGVADPKSDDFVKLVRPQEYRHNFGRYLQVVMNMAFLESPSQRLERMERLEQEMLDPEQAEVVSLQLEAIGQDSLPILRRVLRHDDLEVKFHASQALAYMGEADGVSILQSVAEKEPAFRWHAYKALSSIKNSEATQALKQLLHPKSAETRYGAFQALLDQAPNDPLIEGKQLGDFKLHRIPSTTSHPMIHFSRSRQAEIVLFGENQRVSEDFLYVQPNLTVKGTPNQTVSITRHTVEGDRRLVVSNLVGDLIEGLFQAGVFYGEQLKIFSEAKNHGTLDSRLAINTVPRLGRTYIPGENQEEELEKDGTKYLRDPLPDLTNKQKSSRRNQRAKSSAAEASGADTESNSNTVDRVRSWFTGGK